MLAIHKVREIYYIIYYCEPRTINENINDNY